MALIQLVDVGQQYEGGWVLRDVSLEIDRGEVFALIGPTGSGKTTLIRIMDLLESPASGRILFDGVDVTHSRGRRLNARRRMAYVQQKPIVFSMSVYDNVACGLRWRREEKGTTRDRVEKALDIVGMSDYRKRDAKTLSGGETQRVAIARALATDPEVLLLDEPTANLDPVSVLKVEDVLEQIIADQKITVLVATHDMSQGQRLANRIGVLISGRMLQIGPPGEIFFAPDSTEVAGFVGVGNILPGVIAGKDDDLVTVDVNGLALEAVADHEIGEKVHVLVRPEDVTFSVSRDASSARNVFQGRIARMTPVGSLVRVELDCGFPLLGLVTRRSAEDLGMVVGKQVHANFKATAIHVIKRRN